MSKNLRNCMKTMHIWCDTKSPKIKKSIIEEMSKKECFFEAVYEIIDNIYLKNLELTPSSLKKLKKYLKVMEKIHQRPQNKVIRKKLVRQTGGFLPIVLPILASVISDLISNAISKTSNSNSS